MARGARMERIRDGGFSGGGFGEDGSLGCGPRGMRVLLLPHVHLQMLDWGAAREERRGVSDGLKVWKLGMG